MYLKPDWDQKHKKPNSGKKETNWNEFYGIKKTQSNFKTKIKCETCGSTRITNSGEIVHQKVSINSFLNDNYICEGTRFAI